MLEHYDGGTDPVWSIAPGRHAVAAYYRNGAIHHLVICINRLQRATGGESFNNLLEHTRHVAIPEIDFRQHAESLGALAEKAANLTELEGALRRARDADRTSVIVIDTDPLVATEAGGHWWDVAVPEVSERAPVREAREAYEAALGQQRLGD